MISSAISADLGRQDLVKGSSEALATVTGIVDGTGSIGAAVGQVRLPKENQCLGKEAKSLLWLEMEAHSSVQSCMERERKRGLVFCLFVGFCVVFFFLNMYLFKKPAEAI